MSLQSKKDPQIPERDRNKILTQHAYTFEGIGPTATEGQVVDLIPSDELDVQEDQMVLIKKSAIDLPAGTTAERPTNPNVGTFRYNSTLDVLEVYNGSDWDIHTLISIPDLSASNIFFVSKAYGTSDGLKGNINSPYDNIYDVLALMEDGDIVWVLDGIYTVTNSGGGGDKEVNGSNQASLVLPAWTSGTYTFYFAPNTGISDTTTGSNAVGHIFAVEQPITVRVYGKGVFTKTTAGSLGSGNNSIISHKHASSTLEFYAKSMTFYGFINETTACTKSVFHIEDITCGGDFSVFYEGTSSNIDIDINNFYIPKAAGGRDYTWEPITFRDMTNCIVKCHVKTYNVYGQAGFIIHAYGANFTGTNMDIVFDEYIYDNDGVGADCVAFDTLYTGDTDDVGNSVTKGAQIVWIRSSGKDFSNNNISVTCKTASGDRIRPVEIAVDLTSNNNVINIDIQSARCTSANAIAITKLRGANTIINVTGNVGVDNAPIEQADTSATGRLFLSGVWTTSADATIITGSGPGLILNGFIGRGGSTATPLSGTGDVTVLSAGFNNTTAITGTTSGAIPLQDTGF